MSTQIPMVDQVQMDLDQMPVDELVSALRRRNFKVSIIPRKCIIEGVTLRLENRSPEGGALLLPLLEYQNLTILEGRKVNITVELDEVNGDAGNPKFTESGSQE